MGGGFGGAIAARHLKRLMPGAQVSLIEPAARYHACPFSNLALVGARQPAQQVFGWQRLADEGINVIKAYATQIDGEARRVQLNTGSTLPWDRLVLAPGIDFRWNDFEGYDAAAASIMPHAWKGGEQLLLLQQGLKNLPESGLFVIAVPPAPFRCPPGPYERASLVANWLKVAKPRAKLLILDANGNFSKKPLFMQFWRQRFGGLVEWRGPDDDGRVNRVEPHKGLLHTDFDVIKADLTNLVPPQEAGRIAQLAGVADASGWCPIDAVSFESRLVPNIHVIGDATVAAPMPKSAFSAAAQARVCALQVARLMLDLPAEATTLANTCYSFIDETEAISVSGVYHNEGSVFANVPGAGGTSPLDAELAFRQSEARQAEGWFHAITQEAFL